MGLVERSGRIYLYRSVRKAGRVTSRYVASGHLAELINASEAIDAERRAAERAWDLEQRQGIEENERELDAIVDQAVNLARAALSTAGFTGTIGASGGEDVSNEIAKPAEIERFLDQWVTSRIIDWAAGREGNEKTKRKLWQDMNEYSADLAGPNPSPMESMLARTAAVSWFSLRLAEGQHIGGAISDQGLSIAQSEHHQRRVDRAHRRLMSTLKTLATVRRLMVPTIQVNVAREQVNIASGSS